MCALIDQKMTQRNYFSDVMSLLYGRVLFLLVNNTRISIISTKSRQSYVLIRGGLPYVLYSSLTARLLAVSTVGYNANLIVVNGCKRIKNL